MHIHVCTYRERERKRERDRYIDRRQKEKGATEDEMIGWHQWHNGHEFEKTLGDSEGQGSLPCCSPWGHKETKSLIQLSDWTTIYIYVCMYTPAFYLCIHRHRYTYIHIYISLYCLVFFFWNNIYLSLYVNRERETFKIWVNLHEGYPEILCTVLHTFP